MTPLPSNPVVVILIDPETKQLISSASNIPELFVNVTDNPDYFVEASKGKSFVQ